MRIQSINAGMVNRAYQRNVQTMPITNSVENNSVSSKVDGKFNLSFGNKLATDIADTFGEQVGKNLLKTLAEQIAIVKGQATDSKIVAKLEEAGNSLKKVMSDTIKKLEIDLCGNHIRVKGKDYTEEEFCNLILKSNKYLEENPDLLKRFVFCAPDDTTPGYFRFKDVVFSSRYAPHHRFTVRREGEPSLLPVLKEIAELRNKPHKYGFKDSEELHALCEFLDESPETLAKGKLLLRIYDTRKEKYLFNDESGCLGRMIYFCPDDKLQRAAILYSRANFDDYINWVGTSREFKDAYRISKDYVNLSYEELIKKFEFLKDVITKEQWDAAGRGELKSYGDLVFD